MPFGRSNPMHVDFIQNWELMDGDFRPNLDLASALDYCRAVIDAKQQKRITGQQTCRGSWIATRQWHGAIRWSTLGYAGLSLSRALPRRMNQQRQCTHLGPADYNGAAPELQTVDIAQGGSLHQ